MRYTKFVIKNYKGIQDLTIDLEKQPNSKIITLVGLNESGKTSILQAINFLQHGLPENERHKLIPKKDKFNFSGSVSVQGQVILNDEDNLLILKKAKSIGLHNIKPIKEIIIKREHSFDNSKPKKEMNYWTVSIEIQRTAADGYILISNTSPEWLTIINYLRDELIPKILYYSDFLFDFPLKIYLDKETSISKKQLQFREVIQDILSSIGKDMTIENHLVSRLKEKTEASLEALGHTLSKMSAEISNVVLGAWKNIMNIQGKEFFVEAKSEFIPKPVVNKVGQSVLVNTETYYLEFRLKEGTEKYYVSERSLGFKWFFTFLLFTEFRKNRKTDIGETLFLLDEPASNLHSTAQKKLLDKFADLAEKSRLVYTTHSHHLINPKWLSGTYIIKNEAVNYKESFDFNTNETNIKAIIYKQFVASNPEQQDYFQPILDALDYQPGMLEKIPDIVLTEGKFDYYILRYINEIILDTQYPAIRFYPGNGADGNEQIIRLYMAWGRNFKILLDGDEGGEKAKVRYIKIFGDEIKNHIITFCDIVASWNYPIEQLFNDEERLLITQQFDGKASDYEKSKFNTAIQNLYINQEKLQLNSKTLNKFGKIYEKLK